MGVTCLRKSNLNKKSVNEATEVDPTILSPCSVSSTAGQIGETCKSQRKCFRD